MSEINTLNDIIKYEKELTLMFDSDTRVAMALLEKIRNIKPKKTNSRLAIKIVEIFNPDIVGKWDSQMYEQKESILKILNQTKEDE